MYQVPVSTITHFPQALPCTLGMIEANPTLKEDHCMGVILATFPLTYTAFDNNIAAGNYRMVYSKISYKQ